MIVYLAVLCSLLQSISMRGAKMVVSLSALSLGATPFQVGILASLFAAFPLLLAVTAGRVSDRIGVRRPMISGALVISCGIASPLVIPGLPGLIACATLIGLGHIFFHVSVHNLIGAYGAGEARTRNFATFSLGQSVSAFIGPALAGFSIDGMGFPPTHAMLAVIALLPATILAVYPKLIPERAPRDAHDAAGGSLGLLRNAGLRRTLIMSGVTLTGIELFTFYFPVYGRSIGLSASMIGLVMASYAVAAFIVRLGMHSAARRIGELGVLTASLFVAGLTYLVVPMVSQAPLLALVAFYPRLIPPRTPHGHAESSGSLALLASPGLRRTLVMSGVTLTGIELFTFYFPVYGRSIGLSASAIGMVMASYAVAAFIVRMGMARATRAIGELGVLTASLLIAGATYMLVPLVFGAMGSAFGLLPVFWANGVFLLAGGAVSLAERKVSAARAAPEPVTQGEDA